MQAMELLSFHTASTTQLAEALRVHPGTARRLLDRLVADGWVVRSDGYRRTYRPTLRVVAMAAQLAHRDPLTLSARPIVARLHAETGGVAHLCVPSYRSALCLVHRGCRGDAGPRLRELVPAHAAAAGKVLLAHRAAWRASVLRGALPPLTSATLVAPDDVERDAALTRERGFAVDEQELQLGVRGVAVPVVGSDGEVLAALALSAPVEDLSTEAVAETASLLTAAADELHHALLAS